MHAYVKKTRGGGGNASGEKTKSIKSSQSFSWSTRARNVYANTTVCNSGGISITSVKKSQVENTKKSRPKNFTKKK
jgi:hypothetical protein